MEAVWHNSFYCHVYFTTWARRGDSWTILYVPGLSSMNFVYGRTAGAATGSGRLVYETHGNLVAFGRAMPRLRTAPFTTASTAAQMVLGGTAAC